MHRQQGSVQEGGSDWLEMHFFSEYGEKNVTILGEAWGNAISAYLEDFPIDWSQKAFNDTALDAKIVQGWVLLGDPSLQIGGFN